MSFCSYNRAKRFYELNKGGSPKLHDHENVCFHQLLHIFTEDVKNI
jgi:hypothetical protein